jgi:MoxR-like ATPase
VIPGIVWTELDNDRARELLAQLLDLDDARLRDQLVVDGWIATLPFYRHWRLVRLGLQNEAGDTESVLESVYALWREGLAPLLLDGSSAPVHEANGNEGLELDDAHVADYIRWFCFAIRGDNDQPFVLFEKAPEKVAAKNRKAAALAEPLTPKGKGEDGALLYETTVIFAGAAFTALFGAPKNGEMVMVDDEPLMTDFPAAITPAIPPLGLGPRLMTNLAQRLGALPAVVSRVVGGSLGTRARAGRRKKGAPTGRPTVIELVELLLARALRDQAQNRLLGFFNATLPAANELQRFAALLGDASPVVIVETNIPFVEETISDIVNELRAPKLPMLVCRGMVQSDANGVDVISGFALPSQGPAMVLLPLQVYPRAVQVERLAFDIAALDLAAIITCERFGDLPEALRRYSDLVLRLPEIDTLTFETLFQRVLGQPLPADWLDGGSEWVKHLLHTDFEHPRRMRLSPKDAFGFIRAQVEDRLHAVDPAKGMGLAQLHGLGEAREFAEDLIADIHAAMAGTLPWSQVDRGALLVGAPGTGKTTLAKAIAKDCGIKFIQASASGWMAEGVSLGPHIAAIRRTFSEARDYAPAILFIDEIDSIGSRENFAGDHNSIYQTEVVNAVLEQIQGLDPAAPVFIIGATNHEESVDPALRRAGRLDRVIRIPRPNSAALDHIYRYYIAGLEGGIPVDPGLDTLALARLSVGLTGADVERVVRGAARRARKAGRALSQTDVIDEITNKPRGSEAILTLTPADIERTATHESGHALALFLSASKGADIGFVTIVPRDNGTLGFVAPLPDERVHLTRHDYEEQLDVFVAGRAAEELKYGKDGVSSGASNDLESATVLVTRMVTQLGLAGSGKLMWSDTMSTADRALAETAMSQSYDRALKKLKRHRPQLDRLARALIDRQELTGDEARAILGSAS